MGTDDIAVCKHLVKISRDSYNTPVIIYHLPDHAELHLCEICHTAVVNNVFESMIGAALENVLRESIQVNK